MSWSRGIKGLKGLGKAVSRRDRATNLVINYRRSKCRPCPARRGMVCSMCKCVILAKTSLIDETCPGGRW